MMGGPAVLRDVVVIGGGCYGTFYAGQLAKAKQRGKADYRRVIIVDRDPRCRASTELPTSGDREIVVSDWHAYFDRHLGAERASGPREGRDVIVPSPHTPHLMFEWLLRRARGRLPGRDIAAAPVGGTLDTPYDRTADDGARYVSFADWVCPTHCIEPALCPAIGRARSWEMPEAVRELVERMRQAGAMVLGPALFVCRHHAFGVGTFPVEAVLDAMQLVEQAAGLPGGGSVLVGTVSSCHGALNMLTIGPLEAPDRHGAG
jgi:hypothetical protein